MAAIRTAGKHNPELLKAVRNKLALRLRDEDPGVINMAMRALGDIAKVTTDFPFTRVCTLIFDLG